jgi:hypothetical protein
MYALIELGVTFGQMSELLASHMNPGRWRL